MWTVTDTSELHSSEVTGRKEIKRLSPGIVNVSEADPIHDEGRQQRSESKRRETDAQTGSYEHGMRPKGTHRNVGEPLLSETEVEVGSDNLKRKRGDEGVAAVGSTHNRGVGGLTPADSGNRRGLEGVDKKAELESQTAAWHRPRQTLETRFFNLSNYSPKGSKALNLMRLFSVENMGKWFAMLRKDAASGVDKERVEDYSQDLKENLEGLEQRLRKMSYRPKPVRRVYIPKSDGKKRPLGIPAVEDKIIQQGIAEILRAIYEPLFRDSSHGFRPGRSCHTALKAVDVAIMQKPTNHIVDADIKGFFDSVVHEWLMKMLQEQIGDRTFLRLIKRFLKAGVMEDDTWRATEEGTPQGGIISPVLSNIYLHYVLDLWFAKAIAPRVEGYAELIRYADDFIICVQKKEEAYRIYEVLKKQLGKFGLEVSEEKTRVIPFGRYAKENARRKGEKPPSFDFLGFTHFNDQTRRSYYKLGRRTSAKKYREKLRQIKEWIKMERYMMPLREWWLILKAKLLGHQRYYGVSGNCARVRAFTRQALYIVAKWVSRMSQRRLKALKRFYNFVKHNPLPEPRIYVNLCSF